MCMVVLVALAHADLDFRTLTLWGERPGSALLREEGR